MTAVIACSKRSVMMASALVLLFTIQIQSNYAFIPNNIHRITPPPTSFLRLKESPSSSPENLENSNPNNNSNNINGFSSTSGYNSVLIRNKKRAERRTARQKLLNSIYNFQRKSNLVDEDGYLDLMQPTRPLHKKAVTLPFKFAKRVLFPEIAKEPGTLILVRHGESLWNYNKTFTGWADPDLSERGFREAEHAARLLLESGYEIDVVFTSRLQRAIRTAWIILQELNKVYLPVFKSWRLNERMYGALTGLSKTETAARLGEETVQEWRGSLRSRPPALKPSDIYWPGRERKYSDLDASQIPCTESLLDCMTRAAPVWEEKITYELRRGRTVLVVAHANTLRGLVKIIDGIGDSEIQEVAIPTGIPIVYKFNNVKELTPVPSEPNAESGNAHQVHMNGLFLEKPGLLKEALKREEEWCNRVPGYDSTMARTKVPMTPLERSLTKLQAERELKEWANTFIDPADLVDDGDDGNFGRPINFVQDQSKEKKSIEPEEIEMDDYDDDDMDEEIIIKESENVIPTLVTRQDSNPCQTPLPSNSYVPGIGQTPIRKEATIVIIRHGKTEHNKLGLFTGWEDAPLAQDGVEEAKAAGKLLKAHGFEFDIVYTSWLSRAIDTAWIVIDQLDSIWLPIVKTWRLNERMYGDLTGLSKQMVKQRHGEKQFKAWRRGYKVRPPPVSSFSPNYPGNDLRYVKFMKDVRYSVSESLIRSIEWKGPKVIRKFPKSESLRDCMERTIPFFTQQIESEAINKGKRVLIASSENAIRGLLMHLCEIPEEKIVELEIPNGLPLIFDIKSKCVKLLDDGTGRDPLEVYNFGKAASYLFRPCTNEDGTPDEECDITFMSDSFELSEEEKNDIADLMKVPRSKTDKNEAEVSVS